MPTINTSGVLLGGLVAGIVLAVGEMVLNAVVLSGAWEQTSLTPETAAYDTWQALAVIGVVFVNGFVLTWLYAAIRPRFGPGPRTAIIAGLALWAVAWVLMGLSLTFSGIVTARIALVSAIWGLFEVPLASLAGAWLYREGGTTASVE